jgi:general secretion pathway protein E
MGSPVQYPLPYAFARSHELLLEEQDGTLTLWLHGLQSEATSSAVGEVMRKFGVQHVQTEAAELLRQRISAAYAQSESSAATVISEVEADVDLSRMMQALPAIEDLLETSDDAPIIRMLNALLTQAARDGASDIHIEPYERHSSVRFRVDGSLRDVVQPNRALHAALISRLKIMADLDIAEKRLPQDGRISLRIGTRGVMCVSAPCPVRTASAPYCVCWTRAAASSVWSQLACRATCWTALSNWWPSRTASFW